MRSKTMNPGRRLLWLLIVLLALVLLLLGRTAQAQTSSLYMVEPQPRPPARVHGLPVNPYLERASYTAVHPPELRQFAVHDLVTIVIREQSSSTSESTLETEKETRLDGGINAFPRFNATDLLNLRLRGNDSDNLPLVDVGSSNEFEGGGEYERRDTMTTRLTARVVDVKPNGTLALEARTHIQNDDETQAITVTGYCQPEDVAIDNSILSTQIFDLRIAKTNTGELRDASEKGIFTRILDAIFNF